MSETFLFKRVAHRDYSRVWKQEEFCDVALVGDDCERIPAHKLVLVLESEYCRKRLRKTTTEICIGEADCRDINNILQLIYHGKVDIEQDEVEGFLRIGRKLEISLTSF